MSETLGELLDAQHAQSYTDLATWLPEDRVWLVKETEHWRVVVNPMIFNFRVCLSDKRWPLQRAGYTAGWCYAQGAAAFLAALAWDPETDVRPLGWHKEAINVRGGSLL